MFTVESILSMKKATDQLDSVGDGEESMSDIDPGEEGKDILAPAQ